MQAHIILKPKQSIPIHFGTFQLSDEGIDEPLQDLDKALKDLNVSSQTFFPLKEGEAKNY